MSLRLCFVAFCILLTFDPIAVHGQWVQTRDSATVISFAANSTNLFAGTYDAGRVSGFTVFRSTDSGSSWIIGSGPGGPNLNALVVIGANVFAGTDGSLYYNVDGVYLSTNNGTSWTATWLSPPPPVNALAIKGCIYLLGVRVCIEPLITERRGLL